MKKIILLFLLCLLLGCENINNYLADNIDEIVLYWYPTPDLGLKSKTIFFYFANQNEINNILPVIKTLKINFTSPKVASIEGYYKMEIKYTNGKNIVFEINSFENFYLIDRGLNFESKELMLYIHAYIFRELINRYKSNED